MLMAASWGGADWAQIITAVGTVAVALGVFFVAAQVRTSQRAVRQARAAERTSELVRRWESAKLARSRELIRMNGVAIHGHGSPQAMVSLCQAVRAARIAGSKEYRAYARYVNYFEQVGISCAGDRAGLLAVYQAMGRTVEDAWETWQYVLPYAWGPGTNVGGSFRTLAGQLRRVRLEHEWAADRPDRRQRRQDAFATGGLQSWMRQVRSDRRASGLWEECPSTVPVADS
jgi:hypothetical protein